jgi:hypothetical protein
MHIAAAFLTLLVGASAQAQPVVIAPPAQLSVRPEGGGDRYRYLFELRAIDGPAEVIADRRLLRFEVRAEGSRRRIRCRHPAAPRRAEIDRIRTLGPGADPPVWREWIDLRMYCWGAALRALDAGGTLEVTYGFDGRRATRTRWVARPPFPVGPDDERASDLARRENAHARTATTSLRTEPLAIAPAPPPPAPGEGSVRVTLASADAQAGATSFRVTLRTVRGTARIYPRNDLFRFRVRGPLGEVECALHRQPIVPIIDFYRRISTRGGASFGIETGLACPDGTFDLEGIYEVTPFVDLIYDGARYELEDVATGTFEGPPAPVRIRRSRRGYFEQIPDAASPRVFSPGVT